jgi:hypothetical protein
MDTLVLQGMMRSRLGDWPPLQAIVGQRIYDQPPTGAALPYVVLGPVQAIDLTRDDCVIDWEVFAQLDVWSRAVGFPECKQIAIECDAALGERHPPLLGMRIGFFEPRGQRFLRDPDGITSHGVLEYRARYGPA